MELRTFFRSHQRLVWTGAIVLIGLVAFVLVWFQPQKLLIEREVNERLPEAAGSDSVASSETSAGLGSGTETLATGAFQDLEHETTGTAKVIELANGQTFLRLEDLETSNGPDLRVYLSEIPAADDWRAYGERFIDLGALKGNRGDQNYEIPSGTDLSRYKSAVIWCRRFTVGFGVADLS